MRSRGLFLPDGSFLSLPVSPPEREGESFQVAVTVTESRLVLDLRSQLAVLEGTVAELRERLRQTEYGYLCQMEFNNRISTENEELWDLVEENGIKERPHKGRKRKGRTS